jgi:hypothetical protein
VKGLRCDLVHPAAQNLKEKLCGKQSTLPDEVLKAIAARVEHSDPSVRHAAVGALGKQSTLPDEVLKAIAARLEDWLEAE